MRHGKKFNHLSRKTAHRKAMLANMANSLIMHKRVKTTLAKAKALRVFVEPLITKSKDDSTHSRRVVFSYLQNKETVSELFRDISQKVANRPGGYTRILKTGNRMGDNAEMCFIELVDYNEIMLAAADSKAAAKKSRRRRGGKKTDDVSSVKPEIEAKTKIMASKNEDAEIVENTEIEVVDTGSIADDVIEDSKTEAIAENPIGETKVEESSEENEASEETKEKE